MNIELRRAIRDHHWRAYWHFAHHWEPGARYHRQLAESIKLPGDPPKGTKRRPPRLAPGVRFAREPKFKPQTHETKNA